MSIDEALDKLESAVDFVVTQVRDTLSPSEIAAELRRIADQIESDA